MPTQLQADSSSDFAAVSKKLCGADQFVKGVILQSIYLLDTLVVCLLFRVRVSGSVNPFTDCIISEIFLNFLFILSLYAGMQMYDIFLPMCVFCATAS